MTSLLQNLPRWIFASASSYFSSQIVSSIPMYLEGQERRTEDLNNYTEFRLDGPYVNQCSPKDYKVWMEINILIVCDIDPQDFHKIYRMCGTVLASFNAIPISKLGDGPNDDQSLIDCMILTKTGDQREATRVSHFGRLQPDKPLLASGIEGHYSFYVKGQ
jgi:hypothetical protein